VLSDDEGRSVMAEARRDPCTTGAAGAAGAFDEAGASDLERVCRGGGRALARVDWTAGAGAGAGAVRDGRPPRPTVPVAAAAVVTRLRAARVTGPVVTARDGAVLVGRSSRLDEVWLASALRVIPSPVRVLLPQKEHWMVGAEDRR
jgi:hypothetical protein